MAQKLAALTGATGFLGRRVTLALGDRGWKVRALVRRPADEAALQGEGVDTIPGDLSDDGALRRLAVGADAVVHCAGLIKARDQAAFMAVNRDGAARMAAASAGRLLLVSSLAAREPSLSDYAASKRAGEAAARDAAGDRLAVVRPPVIYGPGDRETLALFRLVDRWPAAPVPANEATRLALAHADDVAETILDVLERPNLCGVYAVGGDRPTGYGWREILAMAARAMSRAPKLVPVPDWTVSAAAALTERFGGLGGATPIFTRGKAREMLHADWSVEPSELVPGGPAARFGLEAGFADAVKWYRAAGWL